MKTLSAQCQVWLTVCCCCAVYMTANLSGGHITPTVTIATMITGHITLLKGVAYVLCQLVGSVFGSLLIVRIAYDPCQALSTSYTVHGMCRWLDLQAS